MLTEAECFSGYIFHQLIGDQKGTVAQVLGDIYGGCPECKVGQVYVQILLRQKKSLLR